MTTVGWLPTPVEELFGPDATAEESYDVLTVDVPPAAWITALETARDSLGCTYFDWLSAVDEPGTGFRVAAHVAALAPVRRLLVRTTVPHDAPALPSAVGVYAGAAWHERETHEMFGVEFTDHPGLDHLLLPENFEGHPLRKDFVLAARVAKAWPGAKEPGESEHGGPKRRQMLPPGVPDPNEWGPLKGQLPPAPSRPARAAGRTAAGRTTGERPVRRTRSAAEGSATQAGEAPSAAPGTAASTAAGTASEGTPAAGTRPRRTRTAAQGSASQTTPAPETGTPADPGTAAPPARRSRSASEGSASQRTPVAPRRSRSASEGSASQRPAPEAQAPATPAPAPAPAPEDGPAAAAPRTPRSPDAPWHHARPAFEEPSPDAAEKHAGSQPEREGDRESHGDQESQDNRDGETDRDGQVSRDGQANRDGQTGQDSQGNRDGETDQDGQTDQDDQRTPRPDEGTDPAGGPR
ncbi:NADH-quinone oxidoreductase subunit C [Streptomyces sp. SS1-1]|uniref:NADH-quinone oxidoreductase subunit C n=1 Tax=Streptomyces sp. SS1-1 TaxID=2651869 RepID=UPI0012507288|nr:NADH-quinone oxidoreductase subunit C [Streptomyces sp. SS1-1]KAB2974199.1 NADH-quinone oxidoreductase subunit C [Streptomyces sp. SS1-1]